jgi:hypothetical protein
MDTKQRVRRAALMSRVRLWIAHRIAGPQWNIAWKAAIPAESVDLKHLRDVIAQQLSRDAIGAGARKPMSRETLERVLCAALDYHWNLLCVSPRVQMRCTEERSHVAPPDQALSTGNDRPPV